MGGRKVGSTSGLGFLVQGEINRSTYGGVFLASAYFRLGDRSKVGYMQIHAKQRFFPIKNSFKNYFLEFASLTFLLILSMVGGIVDVHSVKFRHHLVRVKFFLLTKNWFFLDIFRIFRLPITF